MVVNGPKTKLYLIMKLMAIQSPLWLFSNPLGCT